MVSLGRVVAPAPVNLPSVRYAALLLKLIDAQPVPSLYAPRLMRCSGRRTMAMIQTSLWFPSKSKTIYAIVLHVTHSSTTVEMLHAGHVNNRAGGWVTQQQPPAQPAAAANAWGAGPGDQAPPAPRDAASHATNGPVTAPAPAWGAPRQAAARQVCECCSILLSYTLQIMPFVTTGVVP